MRLSFEIQCGVIRLFETKNKNNRIRILNNTEYMKKVKADLLGAVDNYYQTVITVALMLLQL